VSRFSIDYVCPGDFENLAAEVCYDQQIICRVSNERSDGELTLDFFHEARLPVLPVSVPLSDFIRVISEISSEFKK
jgi:hypothetical protein